MTVKKALMRRLYIDLWSNFDPYLLYIAYVGCFLPRHAVIFF